MTAQISDIIFYSNNQYSIVALEKELPFHPKNYGLEPQPVSTACYRGYYCEYSLIENQLVLSKLNIGLKEDKPAINGIQPQKGKHFETSGFWEYNDLNIPIDYSGGMVIGSQLILEFYIHMGFQRPHSFKEVFELIIDKGKLIECIDHSKRMEEIRDMIGKKRQSKDTSAISHDDVSRFVEDSFSLSYEKKWF